MDKKLILKKETIASLSGQEQKHIQGGQTGEYNCIASYMTACTACGGYSWEIHPCPTLNAGSLCHECPPPQPTSAYSDCDNC